MERPRRRPCWATSTHAMDQDDRRLGSEPAGLCGPHFAIRHENGYTVDAPDRHIATAGGKGDASAAGLPLRRRERARACRVRDVQIFAALAAPDWRQAAEAARSQPGTALQKRKIATE